MTAEERFRIFILGAGFSIPAGYPSAPELWQEISRRAKRLSGRAEKFQSDVDSFLRYRQDCDGIEVAEEDIDFEQFVVSWTSNTSSVFVGRTLGASMETREPSS